MAACELKNSEASADDDQSSNGLSNELALGNCQDPCAWDWQSTKNELKEGFEFILTNELFCDVHFIVGSNSKVQKMGAHKLVLSVRSSVFLKMFTEEWSSDCNEVAVADVEPPAFAEMLRFIYSDSVKLTAENVASIMYAAKKYAILPLENKCADFFLNVLCPENAFNFLSWARIFDVRRLVDASLKFIADKTVEALKGDDFCNIDAETLCLILERSDLRIGETHLFDAVIRWSVAACKKRNLPVNSENQRLVLKDAIPLLRFPLMQPDDFASKVLDSGVLLETEIIPVFKYFNTNSKVNSSIFSDTPRKAPDTPRKECDKKSQKSTSSSPTEPSYFIAHRFQKFKTGNYDSSDLRVKFSVNRDIWLTGFGLYGSNSPTDYTIEVNLYEGYDEFDKPKTICQQSWSFKDSKSILKLIFDKPVEVLRFHYYSLAVYMKGGYERSGLNGLQTLKVNLPDKEWATFRFYKPDGIKNNIVLYGQIPELYFTI